MEARRVPSSPAPTAVIVVGAVAFVVGLALGKDQGDAETARNTLSAILLTTGFLAVAIGLAIVAVRRLRHRREVAP